MDPAVTEVVQGLAMFSLMFAMGLTLEAADFRRIAATPRASVLGTLLQLVIMPVAGVGLAAALDLAPLFAIGLVVIAACPGGMFSNMYVHLGRGHTALSVTLTATATLVTLFTLPLWVRGAVAWFEPGDASAIEMPVLETAAQLSLLTVLPIGLGMVARVRRPALLRIERPVSIVAAVVIVAASVTIGASRPDIPVASLLEALEAASWFAVVAVAIGTIAPLAFGLDGRDTATIAVELVVKNILLALVLAGSAMPFEALIPILAFAMIQTPAGILVLLGWRALDRRGWIAPSTRANEAR